MCPCALTACGTPDVKQLPDGVEIQVLHPKNGHAQTIRLVAVADDIIRVTESPTASIKDRPSLVVVNQPIYTAVTVVDRDSCVVLSTPNIQAEVRKENGEVRFLDAAGQ